MSIPRRNSLLGAIASLLLAAPPGAGAVYLNPDGQGQALIYPYYSVQGVNGNPLNTYITLSNHTNDSKVARVRFREGRNAVEVLSFDVYLGQNDTWTAAVVPASADPSAPAKLITADLSCTNPPIPAGGVVFNNFLYTSPGDDGAGTGLERTREGYVEVIEMARVTGFTAASIGHGSNTNCANAQGSLPSLFLDTPSGGLSGTLTVINVANGMDFSVNADALAELSTRSLYRPLSDSQAVDFNAPEIDPVSHVIANGFYYRSVWSRPVDAVSAVFMRSAWMGEVVLDSATQSRTDVVSVFPTRRSYVTTASAAAPFSRPFAWFPQCGLQTGGAAGEPMTMTIANRESAVLIPPPADFPEPPARPPTTICPAVAVVSIANSAVSPSDRSRALGSANLAIGGMVLLPSTFQNGWLSLEGGTLLPLSSLESSTRVQLSTGGVIAGRHSYRGLPVTGFSVRTFENGTLSCNGAACQGNYGSAFPLTYRRNITP
jgi:hypothetical protein